MPTPGSRVAGLIGEDKAQLRGSMLEFWLAEPAPHEVVEHVASEDHTAPAHKPAPVRAMLGHLGEVRELLDASSMSADDVEWLRCYCHDLLKRLRHKMLSK
jgi:hypothetical protein